MLRIRATNRTIVGYVHCARFPQMQALASLFACGQPGYRGSHGDAVLRFFKIAINPRIDDIEKQVEQEVQLVSRLVEMRGLPYSDCYRRSIACSRRGSRCKATARWNRAKSPLRNKKKNSLRCSFFGGDAGIWTPVRPSTPDTFYMLIRWLSSLTVVRRQTAVLKRRRMPIYLPPWVNP